MVHKSGSQKHDLFEKNTTKWGRISRPFEVPQLGEIRNRLFSTTINFVITSEIELECHCKEYIDAKSQEYLDQLEQNDIQENPVVLKNIQQKIARLKQRGYQSFTDVYIELNPSLCEPPST